MIQRRITNGMKDMVIMECGRKSQTSMAYLPTFWASLRAQCIRQLCNMQYHTVYYVTVLYKTIV